jgi:hypothetical protein
MTLRIDSRTAPLIDVLDTGQGLSDRRMDTRRSGGTRLEKVETNPTIRFIETYLGYSGRALVPCSSAHTPGGLSVTCYAKLSTTAVFKTPAVRLPSLFLVGCATQAAECFALIFAHLLFWPSAILLRASALRRRGPLREISDVVVAAGTVDGRHCLRELQPRDSVLRRQSLIPNHLVRSSVFG